MSFDATVRMRVGEVVPLYATITPDAGSVVVTGSPTFSLYTQSGGTLIGSAAATGYTPGTASVASVWYTLSSGTITPGYYHGLITAQGSATSDAITRTYRVRMGVHIEAVP